MDSNKEIIHLKKVESIIKESFNFETSLLESSEFIPLNMVITLLPKDKFGRDRNMNFTFIPFLNDELEHVKLIQFFSSIPDSKIEKNSNSIKDLICEINKNTVFGNFLITENDESFYNRLADAIQTAFYEGKGECFIESLDDNHLRQFSNKFELDGSSLIVSL